MTAPVALVTGGSQGIGYACAERLARDGFSVMICARSAGQVEEAAAALRASGATVVGVQADLTRVADCERLVAACVGELGRIDALVNNAAIYEAVAFLDITAEHWDETFAVDLRAPVLLSVAAARHMRQQGEGRIVHISSDSARAAEPGYAAYSAAKAGLVSLAQSMAVDLAQYGVITNCVAPGWTRTRLTEDHLATLTEEEIGRVIPMRRAAEPSEVAGVVSFLCGSDASYTLGQTISVDGGLLARQPALE